MTQRRIYQCAFPYFVTFNALHREWIFEDEKKAELLHEIILNAGILKQHSVYQFCVMPNHVHILCKTVPYRGLENPRFGEKENHSNPRLDFVEWTFQSAKQSQTAKQSYNGIKTHKIICDCGHIHEYDISDFIKSIRGTFSRNMHQGQIWHPRFYDQIIESDKRLKNETNYIINNPIKWDLPVRYQKYPYQFIDNELIDDLFG